MRTTSHEKTARERERRGVPKKREKTMEKQVREQERERVKASKKKEGKEDTTCKEEKRKLKPRKRADHRLAQTGLLDRGTAAVRGRAARDLS